ncbi:MAG: hypothetical protein ABI411_08010 [Tahibacter sp.]
MSAPAATLFIAMTLLLSSAGARAEGPMAGPGIRSGTATASAADADCAGTPLSVAGARNGRNDGTSPSDKIVAAPRVAATRMADPVAASDASDTAPAAATVSGGSAEPAVAPGAPTGLRWQSVLPGSIK